MNHLSHQIEEIISDHQKSYPVDVVEIALDLGIKVYSAYGTEELSGKIIRNEKMGGDSGYAIFVNDMDSPVRKRFTIAHELAHYILHKKEIGDGIVEDALYRSGLSTKQESEANKLAADILMPWHLINQALNEPFKTIKDLAERFKVSPSAMSIRLGIPS